MRLPINYKASTRDRLHLVSRYARPGMKLLEIGCAPGKVLSLLAHKFGVNVTGIDYSELGIRWAKELFETLNIPADLRCEDIFHTSLEESSFDIVSSFGVVEHFVDPTEIIRMHWKLTKPGGRVIISIPDFSQDRFYGRIRRWLDPDDLAIHNLNIMKPDALMAYVPRELASHVEAFYHGRLSINTSGLEKRLPRFLALAVAQISHTIGFLQPFGIDHLAPNIVLTGKRQSE